MGEDSKQAGQHLRQRALQQGAHHAGKRPPRAQQGALGSRHDAAHGALKIPRAQDDGVHVQLELLAAAVDLRVAASERNQRRLGAKCFDVGPAIACGGVARGCQQGASASTQLATLTLPDIQTHIISIETRITPADWIRVH